MQIASFIQRDQTSFADFAMLNQSGNTFSIGSLRISARPAGHGIDFTRQPAERTSRRISSAL